MDTFTSHFDVLIESINNKESEEHNKNLVADFLKRTIGKGDNFYINTKSRNDLVLHLGNNSNSPVGVVFEVKAPSQSSDMSSKEDLNRKSLQQLILYYLRQRLTEKNNQLKYLIVTNCHEWFIFDAQLFEALFYDNKELCRQFVDFEEGRLSSSKTEHFYAEIAKPAIAKVIDSLDYTYIDIRAEKPVILSKFFSPEHLLKQRLPNDSNELNKQFYAELLHIIGLEEVKDGAKKLIQRKSEGSRNDGSLIENTINSLRALDKLRDIDHSYLYGNTEDERLYNISLELVITWINRTLFLKLLEAQIINYNKGSKSTAFLNISKVPDYGHYNSLFFEVLAVLPQNRNADVGAQFPNVPYLNSSLFEVTTLERKGIAISSLQANKTLPLISSTVLKDSTSKKRCVGSMNTLEYMFEFLDAYDFSDDGSAEVVEDNKTLINASVLGLIFEKINGYKDGSFFTPGFVTMYMCRETIRRAVLQKFNDIKGWKCSDFNDLYDKIDDKREANAIVNSVRICDPAVGSGHFLVSALNEMISIKSDLKILLDKDGKTLRDYHIIIENDELIITDDNGDIFEYHPKNIESQRVQETIFNEKRIIIEGSLFGVDINPNSVKICQLRLWIELLKNTFYKSDGQLETLPNIDINIKCGNSLISRYGVDVDIKDALKKNKVGIVDYRNAVMRYRNASNKSEKHDLEDYIKNIKTNLETLVSLKNIKKLSDARGAIINMDSTLELFSPDAISQKSEKTIVRKAMVAQVTQLENQINDIRNNKVYQNSMEWRFEFPEVLSDAGDFIGFDAVIGNPPYGVSIKGDARAILETHFAKVPDYEIYYYFIELGYKLTSDRGLLSYIVPNTYLFNTFADQYRRKILENWGLIEVLDCTKFKVFDSATVFNTVNLWSKQSIGTVGYRNTAEAKSFTELVSKPSLQISKEDLLALNQNWGLAFSLDASKIQLIKKIKQQERSIIDCFHISQGYIPYRKSDLIAKYGELEGTRIVKERLWHTSFKKDEQYIQEIFGRDITKYSFSPTGSYVYYGKHLACYVDLNFFDGKRLLVREITSPTIIACLLSEKFVNDPQLISIIVKNEHVLSLEILWAILNSKLATFFHFNNAPKATKGAFPKILVKDLKEFPLPNISESCKEEIESLVDAILQAKKHDTKADTSALEAQIDTLVYALYNLTNDEIAIIETK